MIEFMPFREMISLACCERKDLGRIHESQTELNMNDPRDSELVLAKGCCESGKIGARMPTSARTSLGFFGQFADVGIRAPEQSGLLQQALTTPGIRDHGADRVGS